MKMKISALLLCTLLITTPVFAYPITTGTISLEWHDTVDFDIDGVRVYVADNAGMDGKVEIQGSPILMNASSIDFDTSTFPYDIHDEELVLWIQFVAYQGATTTTSPSMSFYDGEEVTEYDDPADMPDGALIAHGINTVSDYRFYVAYDENIMKAITDKIVTARMIANYGDTGETIKVKAYVGLNQDYTLSVIMQNIGDPAPPSVKAEDFISMGATVDVEARVAIDGDSDNVMQHTISLYPTETDWLAGTNAYHVEDIAEIENSSENFSHTLDFFGAQKVFFIGVKSIGPLAESTEVKTFLLPGDLWNTGQQGTNYSEVDYNSSDKYFVRYYTGVNVVARDLDISNPNLFNLFPKTNEEKADIDNDGVIGAIDNYFIKYCIKEVNFR